jgi:hypothetical protein
LALSLNSNGNFACVFSPSAALSTVDAAKRAFVNFNGSGQLGSVSENSACP